MKKDEAATSVPWLLKLELPDRLDAEAGSDKAGAAPTETAPPNASTGLPADTLGLALSGGGIRSAAFCLGLLQALARRGWLRRIDFLSTVSGGGYIGAFLGRFFDLCAKRDGLTGAIPNDTPGAGQERVAAGLANSQSTPITWLRRHANYLSPTGLGETATNLAGFWRNLLSIYLVLAFFFFALFGILNAIGYSSLGGQPAMGSTGGSLVGNLITSLTPLVSELGVRAGPWAVITELVLWLAVIPLMIAYWLGSQDLPEAFIAPVLAVAAILAGGLLIVTVSPVPLIVLAFAVIWVLRAWGAVRRREGHRDPLNPFRLLLARNILTRWLAFWFATMVVFALLAVVDGLGRLLAKQMIDSGLGAHNVATWFVSVGSCVLLLALMLRTATRFMIGREGSFLLMAALPYLWTVAILLFVVLPLLVALSFVSHIAYEGGDAYTQGLVFTGVAVIVSLLLGSRQCLPFVNRSSPLSIYAARLARAFLGAVNPARRVHPDGADVTQVIPGDDLPLSEYAPQNAGGPLHLINCAVTETVDVASLRGLRDRQAENMAVGPAGVNLAQIWHAVWVEGPTGLPALIPLATDGTTHPFLDAEGNPVMVESLDLREWIAISGGAVNPAMGRRTTLALALLFTLANLRLGYWWNSGLDLSERRDVPFHRGIWRSVINWLADVFRAQTRLLAELTGRFAGPWERHWNLSDGGHFENTGAYELLRRRVPFVILCDAGQDLNNQGTDLALLVRLARVDLGAEFEEWGSNPASLQQIKVPSEVVSHLGILSDVLPAPGALPRTHAVLFLVRYPQGPRNPDGDPWLRRSYTWLLYIKATRTGDEPPDVRNYAAVHPDFPNETTLNQVFDEPQWESYRKLGEHIGEQLFT